MLTTRTAKFRLITAHAAITTHISHQTRTLHNLTYPLLNPLAPPPPPDISSNLLPELVSLRDSLPRPQSAAHSSLATLHALTAELAASLAYLSDTLHMTRQTTATASRRLRSAKELVADLRRDADLREEGDRWLVRGNWGERLARRECAHICGEVMGGFEEACDQFSRKLRDMAEGTAQG